MALVLQRVTGSHLCKVNQSSWSINVEHVSTLPSLRSWVEGHVVSILLYLYFYASVAPLSQSDKYFSTLIALSIFLNKHCQLEKSCARFGMEALHRRPILYRSRSAVAQRQALLNVDHFEKQV